jgi:hypothetical protein
MRDAYSCVPALPCRVLVHAEIRMLARPGPTCKSGRSTGCDLRDRDSLFFPKLPQLTLSYLQGVGVEYRRLEHYFQKIVEKIKVH